MIKVAVIGAGFVGRKRALSISADPRSEVAVVCDVDSERAKSLADTIGCRHTLQPSEALRWEVDVAVVSTINKFIMPVGVEALNLKEHLLCEKPLGRNPDESLQLCVAAAANRRTLKTGFNHRFHPALQKAHQVVQEGGIGRILHLRARYGHGGRPGMEEEWRCDPDLSGGGELTDQGVHCFDLFRWFGGEFESAFGRVEALFWRIPVEDNAYGFFGSQSGISAQFHVSWTQWKNLFSFEVFGEEGFVQVEGLGGSYGTETLTVGRRSVELGSPTLRTETFPGPDQSWNSEWAAFVDCLEGKHGFVANGVDGLRANEMAEAIYLSDRQQRVVKIENRPIQTYTLG